MKKKGEKSFLIVLSVCTGTVFVVLICGFIFLSVFAGLPATDVSSLSEDPAVRTSRGEYDEYGMVANSKIILSIGDEKEVIDFSRIVDWIILEPIGDDLYTYDTDTQKIAEFSSYLAEKYNTFVPYVDFVASNGETIQIVNQSTGWIMDEDYACERLAELALEGSTVTVNLTDNSEESKKWWVRFMGEYGETTDYGNSYAEVSIGSQYMWLYIDGQKVLESPVITGNPNMGNDTPTGYFTVTDKIKDATLYGPGYETVVDYWVGFTYAVGFHDAEWQTTFGGDEYLTNGSHGCVNLPTYVSEAVYNTAYVGMPVFVY